MQKVLSQILKSALATVFLGQALGFAPEASADQYYDAGIKLFQTKKYPEAARYFEESIKTSPWESNTYYYCALTYHYMGDFKKAAGRYGDCLERFPGTTAATQATAALQKVDPGYFKRKQEEAKAKEAAAAAVGAQASGGTKASSQDKGTIEGDVARLTYKINQGDKVVEVKVNGRGTPAIFDQNAENTVFSRQQLASVGFTPEKGAIETRANVSLGTVTRKNFPFTIDDSGAPAKIGNSFLDAFNVNIDEKSRYIDLKRKSQVSGSDAAVSFAKAAQDLIVSVDINGRSVQMVFDPKESGVNFTTQQAKNAGLKVDDAEAGQKPPPGEGPQRGEAGWIPEEDRGAPPKNLSVRMKFGPVERKGVSLQIHESGAWKYPKFGPDFVTSGGYKYEIDYKSNKILFTRK